MATVLLTNGNNHARGVKKKTLSEHVSVGANTLVMIIISLICVVSVTYLIHSNKSAAMGYVLKQLKEEEKSLSQEESFWDLKISQARSLETLGHSAVANEMKSPQNSEYVRGDTAVALNK